MYNRSVEFAEKQDILYRCQFGFRKNHSTSHALIHLVNKIASAIDQHETTVGVFLDLSKVFDTLDHQILLYVTWLCSSLKATFLAAMQAICLIQSSLLSSANHQV